MCAWRPQQTEEGTGSPGLELEMVVCHHMGSGNQTWAGPLQEQEVRLTSEPSLKPPDHL